MIWNQIKNCKPKVGKSVLVYLRSRKYIKLEPVVVCHLRENGEWLSDNFHYFYIVDEDDFWMNLPELPTTYNNKNVT